MSNNSDSSEYVDELVWEDYSKGDSLEGILVDVLEDMGEYNNRLYKIQNDEALYAVWSNYKLREQFKKLKVSIGMRIRIVYNGLVKTGNGFDMKDFSVIVLD